MRETELVLGTRLLLKLIPIYSVPQEQTTVSLRQGRQTLCYVPCFMRLSSSEPRRAAGFLANYGCGTN